MRLIVVFLLIMAIMLPSSAFADTTVTVTQPPLCPPSNVAVPPQADNGHTSTENTVTLKEHDSLQPSRATAVTIENPVFFVGTPIMNKDWDLVSPKNEKTWYSLLANDDGVCLIGPGIMKAVKKVIIVTDDGKHYEANLVRNDHGKDNQSVTTSVTEAGPRILTDEEMSQIHGGIATPEEIADYKRCHPQQ